MSTKPPKPPNNVPEEDLSLHENFAPVIAENGLIRQPKAPEVSEESLPAFLTQLDTLQDLVQLRQAEQAEQKKQQAPQPPGAEKSKPQAVAERPVLDLEEDAASENPAQTALVLTSAHLPTVRVAQTTALTLVSKLTLARRLKLLKRKRQHKRRLAARAKLRAAQQAQTTVPPKTPKQTSAPAQNPVPKRPSYWKWAFVLLLFLFLGGISGVVPVGKIPGLRNLAYAMGFTKDDTARMSFLRALLTWTDKTIGIPGNWSGEGGNTSLLAQADGAVGNMAGAENDGVSLPGLNSMSRAGGKTSLLDMQALNALQLKKGYALDGVRGAVKLTPGQEEANLGPAQVRDDKVNVRTEANRDKGEVFFGSDTAAVNRHFKDGYDSSKTLAKVKNPHIADGKPIDWLMNTTQQLMRTNGPLGGINRQLEGTRVSWGDNLAGLGEQKPHKDLYYAWISSRMGNRTSNIMLKKSLADVGFLGADMPTMASTALGGGVQIDSMSFQEDQEAWKEYLEFERKCKEALNTAGQQITDNIKHFNDLVNNRGNWDFPSNCVVAYPEKKPYENSTFFANIKTINSYCNQINNNYEKLENQCHLQVNRPANVCQMNTNYQGYWTGFRDKCKSVFDKAFEDWFNVWWNENGSKYPNYTKEQYLQDNRNNLEQNYQNGKWQQDGINYKEKDYIDNTLTFNNPSNYPSSGDVSMNDVVKDQLGGSNPDGSSNYFPTDGDIEQTIKEQMAENKTL